ncbi:GNAT family N-acetyltransferase [Arthrobacter sunyaminii]|uniref:GNAT family N-acetyltransferase n=1 Tax=Arthrobacter sunyaminii TaxID=2816859 RepID=A0A975S4W1_9MICC|nr:GNAT family N-acetyltransferase [Arthrobacter sunyaminii]MBO0907474.1 GNAT family N-acetyltransferase [Arthrobacter sunyaminii]QWQ35051.1 GNAT family N-acetyltransferase [Arthrobacter sunyaminii]
MTELLQMSWLTTPAMVGPSIRNQLLKCWRDVSNTGGAVGFPFPPVADEQVLQSIDALVRSLDVAANRILIATLDGELAGWLLLAGNSSELTAHWARVLRVQTALDFRNCGVGRALMTEVARSAAEDLALEHLRLEVRAGMGLEGFYQSCGWREIGRWPEALRLPGGDRDEVLMALALKRNAGPAGAW